jgi:hypothetical protein
MENDMTTSWKLTVEALGRAASELVAAEVGEANMRLMLGALGHELLALAEQPAPADSPRATARTLLLVAERAAKVADVAASLGAAGDTGPRAAAASAVYLAAALAIGAQAQAAPLLPLLADAELRANFAQEFAAHAGQIEAVVGQIRG